MKTPENYGKIMEFSRRFWKILEFWTFCKILELSGTFRKFQKHIWNLRNIAEQFWNFSEHSGTFQNILERSGTFWIIQIMKNFKTLKNSETYSKFLKGCSYLYFKKFWKILEDSRNLWNFLKHGETFGKFLETFEISLKN